MSAALCHLYLLGSPVAVRLYIGPADRDWLNKVAIRGIHCWNLFNPTVSSPDSSC